LLVLKQFLVLILGHIWSILDLRRCQSVFVDQPSPLVLTINVRISFDVIYLYHTIAGLDYPIYHHLLHEAWHVLSPLTNTGSDTDLGGPGDIKLLNRSSPLFPEGVSL